MEIKTLLKLSTLSFMLGLICVSHSYAFIGGPPIVTCSLGIIVTNLWLFVLCFSLSVIFQGWYISRQHQEVEKLEALWQSFKAKAFFLIYALPILILSDILAIALIITLDKTPYLAELINYPWVIAILYFLVGLTCITFIVGKIETYWFKKRWPDVAIEHLRRTARTSNRVIFALALILIVINKEFLV